MAAITVTEDVITGFRLNTPPQDFLPRRDLDEGFLEFLAPLHRNFSARRTHLAEERRMVLRDSHSGAKPVHRYPGPAVRNGWRIELLEWCQDQRNQILIPDSAHGTNPATATLSGYKTVSVKSDDRGGM